MISQYEKNLKTLPSIEGIKLLEVMRNDTADVVVSIKNKPGKSGSLAVYHYLYKTFDVLSKEAANRGLVLFGEYTGEAKLLPGSHPNIDFLFKVIKEGREYKIKIYRD